MITHSISLIGKRDKNEDQHDIVINLDNKNKDLKNINYFAVYDGHGGKEVSKYLKDNLSNYFTNNLNQYEITDSISFKKYIEKVFDHLQTKLEKIFKNISYNIGSTALVIIIFKYNSNSYSYVANIGDCRSILCDNKNIPKQLTKDHKPNQIDEKKRIEKLNGKIYFDGYDWRIGDLSVSRAFGDLDSSPYVTHKPEIFKYKLKKNDKFIVIGCDGLWDVMSNQDVTYFVLNYINSNKNVNMTGNSNNNVAYLLGNHAIKKGSTDNISIIIIYLN
jgi:serine/threonine protein phosphatase PrpC